MYPWGNEAPGYCLRLNYNRHGCPGDTTRVGDYSTGASPYGVMDMSGNVQEWVADWHWKDYYSHSPESNPTGPPTGIHRVIRGGSWNVGQLWVYSSWRNKNYPDLRDDWLGFRCGVWPTPSP